MVPAYFVNQMVKTFSGPERVPTPCQDRIAHLRYTAQTAPGPSLLRLLPGALRRRLTARAEARYLAAAMQRLQELSPHLLS
ncbi:MAG: hypothetical protein GW767_02540, partial [Rhodobacterales bacterium]|nr:hypothetical protein [Rhodobacterales bacterium]